MKIQVCNAPQNVAFDMLIIKTTMLLLSFGVLIVMATNHSKWMKKQIRAWGPVLYLSATGDAEPRPPEGDFSDVQNLVGGGGKEGERRGDVGWTAGGRMSNESETSGERRKRIARPPLRTRRKGRGREGRTAGAESSLHNKRQLNEGAASRARARIGGSGMTRTMDPEEKGERVDNEQNRGEWMEEGRRKARARADGP